MLSWPKIAVEVAFQEDPFASPATWTDVTPWTWEAHPRRGRETRLDRIESGFCDFVLDDRDRRFEADHVGSPYYPYVLPVRRMRIVAGENLIPANTDFETGALTPWVNGSSGGGTLNVLEVSNAWAAVGVHSARIRYTNGNDTTTRLAAILWGPVTGANSIPVVAGETYTLSAYVKTIDPSASTRGYRLDILWYTAAGVNISTSISPETSDEGFEGRISFSAVAPATAAFARPRIELITTNAPNDVLEFHADAIQLTKGPILQPYVDAPRGIFHGFALSWPIRYRGRGAIVNVRAVDLFEGLANRRITGAFSAALSGTRIGALLDAYGWPAAMRSIDSGASNVQGIILEREPVLQAIKEAADAELGAFFVDGDGWAVFHDRDHRVTAPGSNLRAIFSTNPVASNELLALDVQPDDDVAHVSNEIAVEPPGLAESVASDAVSQGRYMVRTLARQPILTSQADADAQASYLLGLRKDAKIHIPRVFLDPRRDERLFSQLVGREIDDRVEVHHVPWPGGPEISRRVHVEAIEQDLVFRPGEPPSWTGSFALSPADATDYWILDDPALSVLDSTTILAY